VRVIVAACGGKGGNADGGATMHHPATPTVMAAAETPLTDRLVVATVTAPAGVMAATRTGESGDARACASAPVFTVPVADCGTLVGYTTAERRRPRAWPASTRTISS